MLNDIKKLEPTFSMLDDYLADLTANRDRWAQTEVPERILLLNEMKKATGLVAREWAETAAGKKGLPPDSRYVGEEWLSGPVSLVAGLDGLIDTLKQMEGKAFLKNLPVRQLPNGQIAVETVPGNIWDKLLLPGIRAEVWMQKGVTRENLAKNTAGSYDIPPAGRKGKVALVLGAGNLTSIAPLDCLHKLFVEHQVVILKMNPVNEYAADFLQIALKALIDFGVLRIVRGDTDIGEFLCNHPDVEEIHITGSEAVHDAIIWGSGEEGKQNKLNGTPWNHRRITSELGAICPTIVVPGPWSEMDIAHQAEHIASQKMHHSGFNCVACQVVILSENWSLSDRLIKEVAKAIESTPSRVPYYPGARERVREFGGHADNVIEIKRQGGDGCLIVSGRNSWLGNNEVFGPAFSTHRISEADEENYLRMAVQYANENLRGTLGANIIIHPSTLKKIGQDKFDEIIAELHYGYIAVNSWSGVGYSLMRTPWGAFPGHTLDDVQSGIGFVHNTLMFDKPERTVLTGPFRTSLRPAWFITNKQQLRLAQLWERFQHKPGWLKLIPIFYAALKG